MCHIPNGFRGRAISMYNRKIVDKKEILRVRTVSNTGIYCTSDRVGTVYNRCSKIPLCNSCEDMACCSSECVLMFLYAGDNIQYVNEQFVSFIHFFLYTSLFIKPHKQKSNWVKSGDLGGQLMVLPRPIHLLPLRCCIKCRV